MLERRTMVRYCWAAALSPLSIPTLFLSANLLFSGYPRECCGHLEKLLWIAATVIPLMSYAFSFGLALHEIVHEPGRCIGGDRWLLVWCNCRKRLVLWASRCIVRRGCLGNFLSDRRRRLARAFASWHKRPSTAAVERAMIAADISRKCRSLHHFQGPLDRLARR